MLKEHWFKIGILIIVLLIIGLFSYYFMIEVPHTELAQTEMTETTSVIQKDTEATELQTCLTGAEEDYSANWDADCKFEAVSGSGNTCLLSSTVANEIAATEQNEKNNCFQQYPQN